MFGLGKYSSGGRLVVLVRRGACDMGPNLGHVHVRANRRRGDWHGGLWMLLLGGLPGQSQKPDAGGSLPRTDRPHHRAMVIHGCSVDGASLNGRNLSFRSGNDQSRSASVTWPCNARSVEMPSHAPASPVRGSVGNGVVFRIARPRSPVLGSFTLLVCRQTGEPTSRGHFWVSARGRDVLQRRRYFTAHDTISSGASRGQDRVRRRSAQFRCRNQVLA